MTDSSVTNRKLKSFDLKPTRAHKLLPLSHYDVIIGHTLFNNIRTVVNDIGHRGLQVSGFVLGGDLAAQILDDVINGLRYFDFEKIKDFRTIATLKRS